jgi:hypothetical protein
MLHLLELTLKGSILLCAGLGLRFWLIHSSAAQRSLIWTILFAVLLVLPLGLMTKPVWPVQVKWPAQEFSAPTSPILAESSVATTAITKLPEPPMLERWNSSVMLLIMYGLGVAAAWLSTAWFTTSLVVGEKCPPNSISIEGASSKFEISYPRAHFSKHRRADDLGHDSSCDCLSGGL